MRPVSFRLLGVTTRSATFEIRDGSAFESPHGHCVTVDGKVRYEAARNVFTLDGWLPSYRYDVTRQCGFERETLQVEIPASAAATNVREFGAAGDGRTDDTRALQAAIDACPAGGVLTFGPGEWLTGPLFLRSDMDLHFERDARLVGHPDIERWPVLGADVGSWEGAAASCHAALLTGIGIARVRIHGAGTIDGNASTTTWWSRPKAPFAGWRPRLVYLVDCEDVMLQGVTLRNSPSWTVHPLRCRRVHLLDVTIDAPPGSPNTDGMNPESCEDVTIAGCRISTGDDCIAIKAGKVEPDRPAPAPTRRVRISNCHMVRGHGAIVIGSETSGGVYGVHASDCRFESTDRGLRIKTRRGRGASAIVDGVRLENVAMDRVGTPFVVNSFYRCVTHDPAARRHHVDDRGWRAPDGGTPAIRNLSLERIDCTRAAHSAGYVLGLPERPVENLRLRGYQVSFDAAARPAPPDMAESIQPVTRQGLYLCNVRGLSLESVRIAGAHGPELIRENVE